MSDKDTFAIPAPRRLAKNTAEEPKSPEGSPPPEQQQEPAAPQQQAPPLAYDKPDWGAPALVNYGFEALKNGMSIEKIKGPRKDFVTIGRLPLCDIQMEHPSLSRYHCVLQFNTDGDAFIYDLNSAHGTRLNKQRIQPRTYIPLRNGDQLRFGESTRICIFETEKEDEELETEQVVRRRHKQQGSSYTRIGEIEGDENEGISWGFQEDAEEESDEEEGEEDEKGKGKGKGKRTGDADLIDIAKEKMMAEDAKRRRQELEIMYGDDSDEESFYDKTAPKKKKVKTVQKAETHADLVARKAHAEKEIAALEKEIERRKEDDAASKEAKMKKAEEEEEEDLDSYMSSLNKKPEIKVSILKLQGELNKLKKVHERLEKLVKLTKPSDIFS